MLHHLEGSLTIYLLVLYADKFCKHLDQDEARQYVGPDLDPNCLIDSLIVFPKEFFEKNNFEKKKNLSRR